MAESNCPCQKISYLHNEELCEAYIEVCSAHELAVKSTDTPYIPRGHRCPCNWIVPRHTTWDHKEIKSEWTYEQSARFCAELTRGKKYPMIQTSPTTWVSPEIANPKPPRKPTVGWHFPYPKSTKSRPVVLRPNTTYKSEMTDYYRLLQEYYTFQDSDHPEHVLMYPPILPRPMTAWDPRYLPPKIG